MNFEDLSEKLKEKFEELKGQLEESPAFSTLKEKYEQLTPGVQKGLIWSGVVVVSLFLFSCPLSYWSTSSDNIVRYDETRDTIRKLLRTSHLVSQLTGGPEQIPMDQLQSLIQGKLANARLVPEQVAGIQPTDIQQFGTPLPPENILQDAVQVSLKKLNLQQVVDLAYQLQEVHGTVKLAGMQVVATAENDHYFDVVFRMIKFGLPVTAEADDGGSDDGSGSAAPQAPPQGPPKRIGRPQAPPPSNSENEEE